MSKETTSLDRVAFTGPTYEDPRDDVPEYVADASSVHYVKTEAGVISYSTETPTTAYFVHPNRVTDIEFESLTEVGSRTVEFITYRGEYYTLTTPNKAFFPGTPSANNTLYWLDLHSLADRDDFSDINFETDEVIFSLVETVELSETSGDIDSLTAFATNVESDPLYLSAIQKADETADENTTDSAEADETESDDYRSHIERYYVAERQMPSHRTERVLVTGKTLEELKDRDALKKLEPAYPTTDPV